MYSIRKSTVVEANHTWYVCIVHTVLDSREKSKGIKGKRNEKIQNWAKATGYVQYI